MDFMAALEVKNLSKKFGDFAAVNNISFQLKEGEILGFLGPNGAGKTTTIQMLLGVLTPTSGDITYFGKNFAKHREEILEFVNFSSTYTNLPWRLKIREILTYSAYFYNLSNRKQRVEEIIKTFRLEKLLDQEMASLSAGQTTRVNLAKAFLNDPKVVLLDEPTASLDPEIAQFIRSYLLKQQKERKISIIFTSHNMTEVEEVCDRILFINNGIIVSDDTPDRLTEEITTNRVKLIVEKKYEQHLFTYAKEHNLQLTVEDKEYSYHLSKDLIPDLLSFLHKHHIFYYDIAIDKPSLEDYFLMKAKENKFREE